MEMDQGKLGVEIEDRYMMQRAMSHDITATMSPATVAPVPITGAWTRTVTITFKDADGNVHTWLTGSLASAVSIADTSALGTASIASTTLTVNKGVGTVVVTGSAHAWTDTETDTLTLSISICGKTVTGTSVETFTAE